MEEGNRDKTVLDELIAHVSANANKDGDAGVPIIGILTKSTLEEESPLSDYRELIEPKYLMLLKDALVIPISLYATRAEMQQILTQVNAVCLPGGHTNIWYWNGEGKDKQQLSTQYTIAGKQLLELIIELNNAGVYLPVLGICLGFELLIACIAEDLSIIEPCVDCSDYSARLLFTEAAKQSRAIQAFSPEQRSRLESAGLCYNAHAFMVDPAKFVKNPKLDSFFHIVTLSPAEHGSFNFVSTIEARRYPFYATQHHFEWTFHDFYTPKYKVLHTEEAKEISSAFGRFFLNEAKKNPTRYPDRAALRRRLIVNASIAIDPIKGYVFLFNHK